MRRTLCLILLGCQLVSCRSAARPDAPTPTDSLPAGAGEPTDAAIFKASGQMRLINVEGGCWRFDTTDGKRIEIIRSSAPAGLLVEGRQATLSLRLRPDVMSTCMIGPLAEIVSVEP